VWTGRARPFRVLAELRYGVATRPALNSRGGLSCRASSRAREGRQHCDAHLSRAGVKIPAFQIGLCRACFSGEPLATYRTRCCEIQGCGRKLRPDNRSGICYLHQRQGIVSEKAQRGRAAANRRWWWRNRDRETARCRRYWALNRARLLEQQHRCYRANREKVAAKNRAYRLAHRQEIAAAKRAHYLANRVRLLERARRRYRSKSVTNIRRPGRDSLYSKKA